MPISSLIDFCLHLDRILYLKRVAGQLNQRLRKGIRPCVDGIIVDDGVWVCDNLFVFRVKTMLEPYGPGAVTHHRASRHLLQ